MGGTRVTPHLLKAVDDVGGWKPVPAPEPQSKAQLHPEKLQAIRDGLWMVVNAAGTGRRASIKDHDVAGKTGTAQVISNEGRAAARTTKDLRDNGWFVFFAPRDNPQIAGVIKASLSDIKQNSFVGVTAMPQPDGGLNAVEVHLFPESMRGTG